MTLVPRIASGSSCFLRPVPSSAVFWETSLKRLNFWAGTAFLIHKYQVLNIPPVDVDLYIAKITFGFTFSPNLVAIIGMILALVIFQHL